MTIFLNVEETSRLLILIQSPVLGTMCQSYAKFGKIVEILRLGSTSRLYYKHWSY